MPLTPLFIADRDTLKARVRLTGAVNNDTDVAIDAAIEEARFMFYDNLGAARVAEVVGFPYVENATTTNGLLRAKANAAEAIYVRMKLMRLLPSFFIDATNQTMQRWNEEGLSRRQSGSDLENEIERLTTEFLELLDALRGNTPEDTSSINVSTIGPIPLPARPGDSIAGRGTYASLSELIEGGL